MKFIEIMPSICYRHEAKFGQEDQVRAQGEKRYEMKLRYDVLLDGCEYNPDLRGESGQRYIVAAFGGTIFIRAQRGLTHPDNATLLAKELGLGEVNPYELNAKKQSAQSRPLIVLGGGIIVVNTEGKRIVVFAGSDTYWQENDRAQTMMILQVAFPDYEVLQMSRNGSDIGAIVLHAVSAKLVWRKEEGGLERLLGCGEHDK